MSGIPTTPASPLDLFKTFSLEGQKGQPVDPKKVVQLAQEFEGMLMLQMVRQMRQSISFDEQKEEGFGNETMTDTFDVELSRYLAQSGGIGLGKMVQDALNKQMQSATPEGVTAKGPAPWRFVRPTTRRSAPRLRNSRPCLPTPPCPRRRATPTPSPSRAAPIVR